MTDRDRGDWHTVKDAAAILEVSERTIWRRVKAGKMRIDRSETPHLVDVSDVVTDASEPVSEEEPLSYAELKAEVRRLEELVSELRGERDYLRRAHAAALSTSQRLLEHIEEPEEVEEEPIGVLQRVGRWLSGER
jgi:hypothetical protein